MHIKSKLIYFGLFILSLIFCYCNSKPKPDRMEITFWCIDQFGKPVSDASITLETKKENSNTDGKCLFRIRPEDNYQNLKLLAEKEGYIFLGPDEIFIQNDENIDYVINFYKNYNLTVNTTIKRWNDEEKKLEDDVENYGNVEIILNGEAIGKTNIEGTLEKYITEPESEGNIKVIAKAPDENLRETIKAMGIDFKCDSFDYEINFAFQEKRKPEKVTVIEEKPRIQTTRLIINTIKDFHTVVGLNGGKPPANKSWPKHIFEDVSPATKSLEIKVNTKKSGIISLNLQSGCSDSIVMNFNNRTFTYLRKKPNQDYTVIFSNNSF